MNDQELDRLAAAGNALRPDWPVASLRTFLARHFGTRAYRDVALVLANVATVDPPTDTPRLMLEAWPWQVVATSPAPDRHPSSTPVAELCHDHGVARGRCGCARRPPTNPAERADRNRRWAAHVRTQLGWQREAR